MGKGGQMYDDRNETSGGEHTVMYLKPHPPKKTTQGWSASSFLSGRGDTPPWSSRSGAAWEWGSKVPNSFLLCSTHCSQE